MTTNLSSKAQQKLDRQTVKVSYRANVQFHKRGVEKEIGHRKSRNLLSREQSIHNRTHKQISFCFHIKIINLIENFRYTNIRGIPNNL